MSPVSVPQSKLSAVSRNRKAKVSREQTATACAQVLLLPEDLCPTPTPREDKERPSLPNSLPHSAPACHRLADFVSGKTNLPHEHP